MMSRGWFLTLGVAGLLVGCGKSEGGPAPVQQSDLPTKVADLLCNSMGSCCQREGFAFDADACRAVYVTEFEESLDGYDPQKVEYDAEAAGDCLATAQGVLQCGRAKDSIPACEQFLHGKVAIGQPCADSRECREPAGQHVTCASADGVSARICTVLADTALHHGKLGDPCSTTCFEDGDCVSFPTAAPGVGETPAPATEPAACYRSEGLWCDEAVCARLTAVGGPCIDRSTCAADAFCDFTSQLCTAPRANGQPCESSNECQSGRCVYSAEAVGDPATGLPTSVCVSLASVSAEECANEFMPEPEPQPTDPAPAPP